MSRCADVRSSLKADIRLRNCHDGEQTARVLDSGTIGGPPWRSGILE
jgi:hypothetical protein